MMNGNGQQQPGFDGKTEVTVKLTVDSWNVVLSLIAKGPWELADPVIQTVRQQLQASLAPLAGSHEHRADA